jgi:hypothetical protein
MNKKTMNKKTKNFSDLSKKKKDKIIADCCEGANEEQAGLINSVKIVDGVDESLGKCSYYYIRIYKDGMKK